MPTLDCGHGNGRRNRLPHLAGSIVWRSRWGRRFACRWKLISIAHPNPENGYAPLGCSTWPGSLSEWASNPLTVMACDGAARVIRLCYVRKLLGGRLQHMVKRVEILRQQAAGCSPLQSKAKAKACPTILQ